MAVRHAGALLRLHETLCFLQAHPDDVEILALVDRGLEAFGARVDRLSHAARRRLHDTGVAGSTLDYPFGLPMARWAQSFSIAKSNGPTLRARGKASIACRPVLKRRILLLLSS